MEKQMNAEKKNIDLIFFGLGLIMIILNIQGSRFSV